CQNQVSPGDMFCKDTKSKDFIDISDFIDLNYYLHISNSNGSAYMKKTLRVGILRETKNPPDRRVPLTPPQIIALEELYPDVQFFVQPSDYRCYSNEEYEYLDIPLKEDLRECDILMGVKEIDKRTFIAGKTYLFFSHVAKKQPQNQEMFREMADKSISLIDYEYLTTEKGQRVVAFGRHAGIVGAYNGLKILLTGKGRVAQGALETLGIANVVQESRLDNLLPQFN
ncbi:MAG TPA: hypothetical protein VF298_04975, partial [Bacteroidales bacterium]